MEKILERYERYAYAERQLVANDSESQVCYLSYIIYIYQQAWKALDMFWKCFRNIIDRNPTSLVEIIFRCGKKKHR